MVTIHTDGSSHIVSPTLFWGGWAFVVSEDGKVLHESSGAGYLKTGAAELCAIVEALAWCTVEGLQDQPIAIHGDSQYALGCINTGASTHNANHHLRAELWRMCKEMTVQAVWGRGHTGEPLNERADELAGKAMRAFRENCELYQEWKQRKRKK